MNSNTHIHDVLIAGAGPTGSVLAALLAERGLDVLVVDKDEFPRFRIGESLLPAGCEVLEDLGIEKPDDAFLYKGGAEFLDEANQRHVTFSFSETLSDAQTHAWHVDRANFDQVLIDRAVQLGASVSFNERARELRTAGDVATLVTDRSIRRGKFFIDATGQGRFLAKQFRSISPIRDFAKAAVYAHYKGVSDEAWAEIAPDHNIRILIVPDGWAWIIPLPGQRLSIGLVSRNKGLSPDSFHRFADDSAIVSRWIDGCSSTPPTVVGNFSFRNTKSAGARFACVGDSACFLDPVFSSGVSLGLDSAAKVAPLIAEAIERGDEASPDLLDDHQEEMDRAYRTFSALIRRFYHTRFVENVLFGAPPDGEMRSGVTSVLAGDVFRYDNAFQEMLLRSRAARPGGQSTFARANTAS